MKFVRRAKLSALLALAEHFRSARPFPHVVVDDFFDETSLRALADRFPRVEDKRWWVYDNPLERKFAFNDLSQLDPTFREFFDEVSSSELVSTLGCMAGLPNLMSDNTLRGGGLHQTLAGGKLDVHEDFNVHVELNALRRLNMIAYLNDGWRSHWNGALEFWSPDMSACERRIEPIFNRVVLFRTDMGSNHGHPAPLECPAGVSRRSLAVYYYEPIEPGVNVELRSTAYKKLPDEPSQPELEELRARRRRGRIEDKTSA